jgi:hypothetical protein
MRLTGLEFFAVAPPAAGLGRALLDPRQADHR